MKYVFKKIIIQKVIYFTLFDSNIKKNVHKILVKNSMVQVKCLSIENEVKFLSIENDVVFLFKRENQLKIIQRKYFSLIKFLSAPYTTM